VRIKTSIGWSKLNGEQKRMTEFYSAFCVDCDLTMKPNAKIEKVAITTTFYECPKCKSRIGIVTLNPLNANHEVEKK
jgi:hypothetical protein